MPLLHVRAAGGALGVAVVLGEEQILGQVRRAFDTSLPALRRVADIALASARELRRERGASATAVRSNAPTTSVATKYATARAIVARTP